VVSFDGLSILLLIAGIYSRDLKMQYSELHQRVQFKKDSWRNDILFQRYL